MSIFKKIKKIKRKDIKDEKLERIPAPAWDYIYDNVFNRYERMIYMYFLDTERTTSLTVLAEQEEISRQYLHDTVKKMYLANILLDEDFEEKNKHINNKTKQFTAYKNWKKIDLEGKDYGAKSLIKRCIKGYKEWREQE